MTGNEIRKAFLDYFASKGHRVVESSPLVPQNDPTLLFTNAGMVQFKDVFTGQERREYNRATTCQKCLRVSGKHNDLENVGRTARHHTFFEMLGNFSFGDYFKRDAIRFAWEFLTERMGLDPDRLWVTIYEEDDEARDLWLAETPVPAERIVRCGAKDNFWAMGDTGPCGPCSEIHFDQGPGIYPCPDPDRCGPECDCDRFLELWNLVFMQFERAADGTMTPLPKPSIDTGMGLERVTAVVQKVHSNYDTDLFRPIIEFTAELAGVRYGQGGESDVSLRVVADHIRATTFLIADGVLPSNEGRGYVLRRIMRRAMRHGRMLGFEDPFFHRVSGMVIDRMEEAYPELSDKREYIAKVILHEEERFSRTLDRGLQILEEEVARLEDRGEKVIPGDVVFRLYDTYGFPVDLTADIVRDRGFTLDEAGFETEMEAQREKARAAWKGSGEEAVAEAYRELRAAGVSCRFVGYERLEADTTVAALVRDGARAVEAREGEAVELVLAETPFYGESGGQVGDAGSVEGEGFLVRVENATKPFPDLIVLHGTVVRGKVREGDRAVGRVEAGARFATAQNHSATHLLHAALRQVLGDHVKQAGSLVAPDRLRFDFTHFAPMTPEEIREVERRVNRWVQANHPVAVAEESFDEARRQGVTALFGEKYGDVVRVVRMGEVSAELCGGTHASRTGDIGFFKILSEGGVAAGVRRIEAATGDRALEWAFGVEDALREAAGLLRSKPEEVPDKVRRTLERTKELEREISSLRSQMAGGAARDVIGQAREVDGVKVLSTRVPAADPKALREFADGLRDRIRSGVVVLGAEAGGKALLLVAVTKDLTGRIRAGDLIKPLAQRVGGRGGGKPELAQAGGPDPSGLDNALDAAYEEAARLLGAG
ncbi:MAG: alanine--tRNA ligase [Deltaproteobacteria bacterium]|nr:alanine--tRNA ligase [Deltaproteobacteria bacterium]